MGRGGEVGVEGGRVRDRGARAAARRGRHGATAKRACRAALGRAALQALAMRLTGAPLARTTRKLTWAWHGSGAQRPPPPTTHASRAGHHKGPSTGCKLHLVSRLALSRRQLGVGGLMEAWEFSPHVTCKSDFLMRGFLGDALRGFLSFRSAF